MFDLPIISKQARDLVDAQFDDARREAGRGPARARRVRPLRRKARSA
jgi:hypothetical protein